MADKPSAPKPPAKREQVRGSYTPPVNKLPPPPPKKEKK